MPQENETADGVETGTGTGTETKVLTADALAAPLAGAMPEPTGSLPAIETNETTDAAGVVFDPEKHASNPDGSPKKDKRGRFYPAKLGRPRKDAPAGVDSAESPTFAGQETDGGQESTARAFIALAGVPLVAWLGPDAALEEPEIDALTVPTVDLLKRYKVKDVHPGIILAAVATGIIVGKMRKPTVRERWDALWKRFKSSSSSVLSPSS